MLSDRAKSKRSMEKKKVEQGKEGPGRRVLPHLCKLKMEEAVSDGQADKDG